MIIIKSIFFIKEKTYRNNLFKKIIQKTFKTKNLDLDWTYVFLSAIISC